MLNSCSKIVKELVEVATPDEDDEKGLVILKP